MDEVRALRCAYTPVPNILMYLHRREYKVLINIEIHSVIGVEVSVTIYNVAPELGLSGTSIRAQSSSACMDNILEHFMDEGSARSTSPIHS